MVSREVLAERIKTAWNASDPNDLFWLAVADAAIAVLVPAGSLADVSEARERPENPGWAWWTGVLWSGSAITAALVVVQRSFLLAGCDALVSLFFAAIAMRGTVARFRYELWRAGR